jgi:hypothetical protein
MLSAPSLTKSQTLTRNLTGIGLKRCLSSSSRRKVLKSNWELQIKIAGIHQYTVASHYPQHIDLFLHCHVDADASPFTSNREIKRGGITKEVLVDYNIEFLDGVQGLKHLNVIDFSIVLQIKGTDRQRATRIHCYEKISENWEELDEMSAHRQAVEYSL